MLWRMLVAELIGTLLLVFIGCGSIITLNGGDINIVQIGLTFGLTIATIVQVSILVKSLIEVFNSPVQ